jgi:tetratricopeptide (TPR) repeat protein
MTVAFQRENSNGREQFALRMLIAIVGIGCCLGLISYSVSFGFSRLLSRYATLTGSLAAADEAARRTPRDSEAHRARGAILRDLGNLPEAAYAYETAVSLRPLDDKLWSELGIVRNELEDTRGALAAFNESVRTAPFYASPRWQRGNLLLQMGRYDEGFADLRAAAASDQELESNLIDLAWGLTRGDVKLTEQILPLNSPKMRLSYARFLARKGRGAEVLEQIRAVGTIPDQIRREMVSQLIAKGSFKAAFDLWSNRALASDDVQRPLIFDGGFEGRLSLDEIGFGWRVIRGESGLILTIDQFEKQTGMRSLRIQFNGESNPGAIVLSQLVLVQPQKRYRLNFAVRTQDVLTGGLPVVMISDAINDQLLSAAEPIRDGTHGWAIQSLQVTTGSETNAVVVSLRRQKCSGPNCPIFGMMWLDDFSMEELN